MAIPFRFGMTTLGADAGRSGIGVYVVNLIRQFEALGLTDQFELVTTRIEQRAFAPATAAVPVMEARPAAPGPLPELWWHQASLPRLAARRHWDVLFLPAANRRLTFQAPCPMVGTVHDLASSHVRDKYDPFRSLYNRRVIPGLIRRLAHVITVSESSKRDIVTHAGIAADRVSVIPNGVDHHRFRPRSPEVAAERLAGRLGLRGPYLLYVARLEHPGKNHVRLVRAFDQFKRRTGLPHQLVFAGPDWSGADQIHAEIRRARYASAIRTLGFVSAGDLPDLYAAADMMAFPSLYEGFGIPVLEAMAMGTVVACSDTSSLPEVGGDAALYFDPRDETAMADRIEQALSDAPLADTLRQRGLARSARFTWRRTAELTLDTLAQAAKVSHG